MRFYYVAPKPSGQRPSDRHIASCRRSRANAITSGLTESGVMPLMQEAMLLAGHAGRAARAATQPRSGSRPQAVWRVAPAVTLHARPCRVGYAQIPTAECTEHSRNLLSAPAYPSYDAHHDALLVRIAWAT